MPRVNPQILRWARETAGFDLDTAVQKLGIQPLQGVAARDRLRALEDGEAEPSRALLKKMAKQYRRPLLAFYLARRPAAGDRGEDFRTLPEEHSERDEAVLNAIIRDVRVRQGLIRSVLEDEREQDEAGPVAPQFIGSVRVEVGVLSLVERMRSSLHFDLHAYREAPNPRAAFALLRAAVEDTGVFVLLVGDLGSHHTAVGVETFRGISLADDVAPFIVLNARDAITAWGFSLLHEFTHLWLGQTSISGAWANRRVERFCNDVASEFLLPSDEFRILGAQLEDNMGTLAESVAEFATQRNLSASMVAYRLYRNNFIDSRQWEELRGAFRSLWLGYVDRRRIRNRETDGGPNFYAVRRHRLGSQLVEAVSRTLRSRLLTTTKAARVLGVKASQVKHFIDATS